MMTWLALISNVIENGISRNICTYVFLKSSTKYPVSMFELRPLCATVSAVCGAGIGTMLALFPDELQLRSE